MNDKYAPHIEELAKALDGIDYDDIKNRGSINFSGSVYLLKKLKEQF